MSSEGLVQNVRLPLDKLSDQYSKREYHLRSDASRISPSTIGYVLAIYGLHSVHTSLNYNSLFLRLSADLVQLSSLPDRCEWFEYTYVVGSLELSRGIKPARDPDALLRAARLSLPTEYAATLPTASQMQ
jgi:hypothetical protein